MSEILYLLEMMNGAEGISEIEGKVARVGDKRVGKRPSFNGANRMSGIEGKVTRVRASERGQRTSFNEADGISDIEGKAATGSGE
jgi:hypothetical protein